MEIQVKTAIASHLSDAQELMMMGCIMKAHKEINYAKAFLFKFPDTTIYVDEDELDEICERVDKRFTTFNY